MRISPSVLGAVYAVSEVILSLTRRSKSPDRSRDRYSLTGLWVAIVTGVTLSIFATGRSRFASLPYPILSSMGLALFVAGLFLRWYSIILLGRFFTVNVSISPGQRIVESGPYRFLRHPSYSGALLAFVGFGLCLHNWLAILVLLLPITAAFLWRIHVEERALNEAFGDEYRVYSKRTKRLIPFVY